MSDDLGVTRRDLGRWLEEERRLTNQLRRQAEVDTAALNRWKTLADDLAAVLESYVEAGEIWGQHDNRLAAVLARYREARR